eukprot:jgi/Tetstr1/430864/TSEL_002006.t1
MPDGEEPVVEPTLESLHADPTVSGGAAKRPGLLELAQGGRVGAKSVRDEDDYLAVPELLSRAESGYEAVRPVSRVHGLFPLSTDLTNEYLKQDDRRLPAQEEYLWMSCFGAHIAALFVALDELLPYVPAANQDFTPYLARGRNHAEAIDKAFRFRLAFLRRLNEIKRVHAPKQPLLLGWRQQLQNAGVDVGVAVDAGVAAKTLKSYAGRLSQFAEFCHDSENISPLEATTATVVRYFVWIAHRFVTKAELIVSAPTPEYQHDFRALVASVVDFMLFARGLTGVSCRGAASAANAIGVPLSHIRYQGGWATNSDVVLDYIDSNVLPSPGAWFFFGHIAPLRHFQVQQDSAAVPFPVPSS